jgi:hypothetical protein
MYFIDKTKYIEANNKVDNDKYIKFAVSNGNITYQILSIY